MLLHKIIKTVVTDNTNGIKNNINNHNISILIIVIKWFHYSVKYNSYYKCMFWFYNLLNLKKNQHLYICSVTNYNPVFF